MIGTRLASALLTVVAIATVGACSRAPQQSPPGQRPCSEGLAATDQVLRLQLRYGAGATDPEGQISDALSDLKESLRTRAGESAYFSSESYNAAADRLAETVDPLAKAYEDGDESAYFEAHSQYEDARRAYSSECDS